MFVGMRMLEMHVAIQDERRSADGYRATVEESSSPHNDTEITSANLAHRPILFYDGVCGLCNHTIEFIIRRDHRRLFRFAPLQGETARQLLDLAVIRDLKTFVYLGAKREYRRSAAVVRMLWNLGGIWKILAMFLWLIPMPLRELGYRIVSVSRYRLFGKKDVCRIPTPEERTLFFD